MNTEDLTINAETRSMTTDDTLRTSVESSLKRYFTQLGGHDPANLYKIVLGEMEVPLLKMVLTYTKGNQSKAAKILGLSRGTLRKKLAQYDLDNNKE